MCRPRDVLRARAVLHCHDRLRDHLASVGSHDVNTQDLVGLLLCQELDLTLGVQVRLGARVGQEGELSDFVLDTGSLELLLRLADPCDLGVRVHDGGDRVIIDMTMASLNVFGRGDTLLLSLVREHLSECDITNAADVGRGRVELGVDHDATLGVKLNAGSLEVETLSVRPAADGDKNDVGLVLQRAIW